MIIVGINLSWTTSDLDLLDGSVAILVDGDIKIAISEERITRKKYEGGFINALQYCLNGLQLNMENVDYFSFSICCDIAPNIEHIQYVLRYHGIMIPNNKIIIVPSHHLSHAYSTFIPSKYKKSIVLVADNEGNILGDKIDMCYWANSLERISYYIGENTKINLLGRDCDGIGDLGIGAVYSSFTKWLGGSSYQEAGKIMGLAPYGRKNVFNGKNLFGLSTDGRIIVKLEATYSDITLSIRRFFYNNWGIEIGNGFTDLKNPTQLQKDIAYYIQDQLEKILIKKVRNLVNQTGIKSLCISGGVGLNCVANNKILEKTGINKLYVMPASGDQGQCIGNCFYAYYDFLNNIRNTCNFSPYLGKSYTDSEIVSAITIYENSIDIKKYNDNSMYTDIAKLISEGSIIGWFQGGSEFGPRALGNRSILADPRKKEMKDIINKRIKHREYFRPFAPAIIEEYFNAYFESKSKKSPFMLLAPLAKKITFNNTPSIVHEDSTSRVQTVNKNDNSFFYNLIFAFYDLTDVPIILNTSFNDNGEPIIETPKDALSAFMNLDLDYLIIGNYLIKKISIIK